METKQHGGQRANSGRKPLPEPLKKKTSVIRIDAELLPLVEKLKQRLPVTQNQVWKQTSALSEDDLKEQANYIERLTTDKAQLSAQVQQLEKQLQKIKIDNSLQAEIEALKAELATAKANNERLVLKYDSENLRANGLQNQITELKRQPDKLRAEITRLKHLEQDCQAIKANGERCDRPAKGKIDFHGVLINVCLQHQNQLMKQTEGK
jgi:chromosome segregation ATPase